MKRAGLIPSVGAAMALLVLPRGPASGQDLERLASECQGAVPELASVCEDVSLAGAAVQRAVGLALSLGSDIPGTPSTLGLRLGSTPRIGLSLSPLLVRADVPDLAGADGTSPAGSRSVSLLGLRAGAAVGIVDGFQLAPTVGGVLSIDGLATYSYVRLPSGAGFDGAGNGLGLGARIGVFRESFTLPGVSVSVMRRWARSVGLGSIQDGGAGEVDAHGTVTSFRATVGKNLFALGLMVGAGWDRVSGDVDVATSVPGGMGGTITGAATGRVSTDRRLYFVAGWFNFLISQISFEAGLADGFDDPFGGGRPFDASDRSLFLSVGFRITI